MILHVTDGYYLIVDTTVTATPPAELLTGEPGADAYRGGIVVRCHTTSGPVDVLALGDADVPSTDPIDPEDWVADPFGPFEFTTRGPVEVHQSDGKEPQDPDGPIFNEDDDPVDIRLRVFIRKDGLDPQPARNIKGPIEEHYINIWQTREVL